MKTQRAARQKDLPAGPTATTGPGEGVSPLPAEVAGSVSPPQDDAFNGEVEMPTVENEAPSSFVPKPGCKILDVFEISVMYLLELTNSPIRVQPGTLRGLQLSADRVNQLSDSARQHMQEANPHVAGLPGTAPPAAGQ